MFQKIISTCRRSKFKTSTCTTQTVTKPTFKTRQMTNSWARDRMWKTRTTPTLSRTQWTSFSKKAWRMKTTPSSKTKTKLSTSSPPPSLRSRCQIFQTQSACLPSQSMSTPWTTRKRESTAPIGHLLRTIGVRLTRTLIWESLPMSLNRTLILVLSDKISMNRAFVHHCSPKLSAERSASQSVTRSVILKKLKINRTTPLKMFLPKTKTSILRMKKTILASTAWKKRKNKSRTLKCQLKWWTSHHQSSLSPNRRARRASTPKKRPTSL